MKNLKNKITEYIIENYFNTYKSVIDGGICKDLKVEIIEPLADNFEADCWMKTANEMEIELIGPLKLRATSLLLPGLKFGDGWRWQMKSCSP